MLLALLLMQSTPSAANQADLRCLASFALSASDSLTAALTRTAERGVRKRTPLRSARRYGPFNLLMSYSKPEEFDVYGK